MKNKIIITILFFVWLCFWFSSANTWNNLIFSWIDKLIDYWAFEIHFNAGWNDFGGVIIVSEATWNQNMDIKHPNGNIIASGCKNQLRWYYWNPFRGLLPLDDTTKNSVSWNWRNNLNLDWWFYTNCSTWDEWGIIEQHVYGDIEYTIEWEKFNLQIWRKYDFNSNYYDGTSSSNYTNTFIYSQIDSFGSIDESSGIHPIPLWLIYDEWFGIWWAWCQFQTWVVDFEDVVNFFNDNQYQLYDHLSATNWQNSKIDEITIELDPTTQKKCKINKDFIKDKILSIVWLYSISKWTENHSQVANRVGARWNDENTSLWSISWLLNISDILNKVNKTSEQVCKTFEPFGNNDILNIVEWEINCFEWWGNNDWIINWNLVDWWKETTIIVKNWNLVITEPQAWNWNLNIFVNEWLLKLENQSNQSDLKPFDKDTWKVANNWTYRAFVIKWNIVVKWLIVWTDNWANNIVPFDHRLLVNGTLASLNTVWKPKINRINYVNSLFTIPFDEDQIDLYEMLKWRCNAWWGASNETSRTQCDYSSKYWRDSMIVIPSNIPNTLLK